MPNLPNRIRRRRNLTIQYSIENIQLLKKPGQHNQPNQPVKQSIQSNSQPDQRILLKPIDFYNYQGNIVFGFLAPGELIEFVVNGV